ncbi:MAG: alcohol dehydrogenase catalytic domain-containing protein [Deltaproteobacteria bacterium]|nr:alcohol dehydrogenase catalytic domain-containing protein [Deltaproteobacteria bacterium]MBI3386292.1 alcohol dehydrogenase catalytic domain-containing protein [Deltaproteobacteria bacterium]
MRGIIFHGPHDVRVESVPDPRLADSRGAIVRVTRASICGSDLHLYHGTVPAEPGVVIGHECVGVIEDVGRDVRRFKKGDRVIVPGVVGCGDCEPCRRGYPVGCVNFFNKVYGIVKDLPGGQAEAIVVPNADANLYPSPSELSDEQVLFLTDILPTGYYAAQNANIKPGQTVVVVGCGPVGLFALLSAQLFGAAQIFAVDKVGYRLERAKQYGAIAIDASKEDVQQRIFEATDGRGAHAVVEAVGAQETVHLAFQLVRIGGTVSVVGVLINDDFSFPMGTALMKDLTFRIGLVNVIGFIPTLLPLVRSGRLDPTKLISHHMPLAEGAEAYQLFAGRTDGCLKIALQP